MAKLRIFVSSTHYDLKYIRSSLEMFIDSLGYDAVLSEKGNIAYAPDVPLDESCYREVQNCDVYVLLIGGRYGAEASVTRGPEPKAFYDPYESITKLEYKAAAEKDIPTYILIDRSVYAEYQTFQRNRDNSNINYAHVDSVNIFHFIEEILTQPRNNPVQTFDRYNDIETWLREQWAGLFRELLIRMSSQQQLATLSSQVAQLSQLNETLKRYLEEVVTKVSPQEGSQLIAKESERLGEAQTLANLRQNSLVSFLQREEFPLEVIHDALSQAPSVEGFFDQLERYAQKELRPQHLYRLDLVREGRSALDDVNSARAVLGLPPLLLAGWVPLSTKEVGNIQDEHKDRQPRTSDGSARRNKRTTQT
jgi:hypothetical protein